jgi:hypothetical protein
MQFFMAYRHRSLDFIFYYRSNQNHNLIKMKNQIPKFEEFLNERRVNEDYIQYSVADFPIGAEVHMADEIWKVVKPGARGEKIFMAPFNREAKNRYISIAIEFDLNWLNANITKIEKP